MISQGHIQNADVLGETIDRVLAAQLYTFAYRTDVHRETVHAFPRNGAVYPWSACHRAQWRRSQAWGDVDGFTRTKRDCRMCVARVARQLKLLKHRRSDCSAGRPVCAGRHLKPLPLDREHVSPPSNARSGGLSTEVNQC